MKTKKITLFYTLTRDEVWPPSTSELRRKDAWVKGVQSEIAGAGETRLIKVTYDMHNPDIDRQMKYFNGPVVEYFTIQTTDMLESRPQPAQLKQYREMILYDMLGHEVELPDGRKLQQRKSTASFQSVQRWHTFLEELRETYFEPNGYEMPDSETFWELEAKHGYDKAHAIAIEDLQKKLRKKLSTK